MIFYLEWFRFGQLPFAIGFSKIIFSSDFKVLALKGKRTDKLAT